jgi:hypothetical protein
MSTEEEEPFTEDAFSASRTAPGGRRPLSSANAELARGAGGACGGGRHLENGTIQEELTKQQRKRVYVSLYWTHVPEFEDAGLVKHVVSGKAFGSTAAASIAE